VKFSIPIPHSNPLSTSLTSSLKRLSEAILLVRMGFWSRSRRTIEVRVIFPSVTDDPAMVPSFGTLKVCSTFAWPTTFSLTMASSRPSIASFTSSSAS